jgi:hypothetical protein
MRIRIEGTGLPGRSCGPGPQQPGGQHNVHVAVQRRGKPSELLGLIPGDAPSATWTLDCVTSADDSGRIDVRGPYIQGSPGSRFIYLSWGAVADGAFMMFRRAKLQLDAIPADVIAQVGADGEIVGRLGLTDSKGQPLCASVRPPLITWSAA